MAALKRLLLWGACIVALVVLAGALLSIGLRQPPPPPIPYRPFLPGGYGAYSVLARDDFYARVTVNVATRPQFPAGVRQAVKDAPAEWPAWLILGQREQDHLCLRFSTGELQLLKVTGQVATPVQRASVPSGRPIDISRRGDDVFVYSGAFRLFTIAVPAGPLPMQLLRVDPNAKLTVQKLSPLHMTDDFMRESIGSGDAWTPQSGTWRSAYSFAATSPNPFMCQGVAKEGAGVLLTGYLFWNDAEYAVALKPEDVEEAGLVFAYRDERNYCRATILRAGNAAQAVLARVVDGKEELMASDSPAILFPRERWVSMAVECRQGGHGTFSIDGKALLDLPADANTFGKVGLFVRKGTALFDDFSALDAAEAHLPPLLAARSRVYSVKERYPKDDRDDWLYRWAQDLDAWQPLTRTIDGKAYGGEFFHLPLFGDFSLRAKAGAAPTRVVLLTPDGQPAQDFAVQAAGDFEFTRSGGALQLNGVAAGTLPAGSGVLAGMIVEGGKPSQESPFEVRSAAVREELFDDAPAAWAPVHGSWENTNRWRCKQEWGFFSGQSNDCAALFGKYRFGGNQTHIFYYGLRDVFGRQFQNDRYTRHDVNFSFLTDGRDLFSGYTFMYGGYDNKASYLLRRREVVAVNDKARFPLDQGIEDQHLFWRRLRIDCIDRRIRVRLEDQVLIDFTETAADMPTGGHIALWTCRNGVMYARLNSTAQSVRPAPEPYLFGDAGEKDLPWRALTPANVALHGEKGGTTRVHNRYGGGDFAVEYPLAKPIDLNATPVLKMRLDVPEGARVNLHLGAGRRWFIVPLTAPVKETYRVLGNPSDEPANVYPDWRLLACDPLTAPAVAGEPQKTISGEWTINLRDELKRRYPAVTEMTLTRIVIGNSSHADYLMAGLSGNRPDATYAVSAPAFEP